MSPGPTEIFTRFSQTMTKVGTIIKLQFNWQCFPEFSRPLHGTLSEGGVRGGAGDLTSRA